MYKSERDMPGRRSYWVIFVLALGWGTLLALLIRQPGYTDAYYYFNAGQRWAQGEGLTDVTLWTYIGAPDHLPAPSHTYWMPLESVVSGISMRVLGAKFGAAQLPSVLCFAGLATLTFWLGARLGQAARCAWLAALLIFFGGFYTVFWATTDTFALYGLVGAGALVAAGQGRADGRARWFVLGGVLSALGHLARADGLLLVLVLVLVVWWPGALWPETWQNRRHKVVLTLAAVLAYGGVMLPWFVRMVAETGSPLPSGGMQTIWLKGYDEIVSYPAEVTAGEFFEWGADNILRSRWDALVANLGTFVAVETWIILGPFVLAGLWIHRRHPLLLGVLLYAGGLHLAMTFVFAYPGIRGGLFHSAAALLPYWASLGVMGLDAGIDWLGQRRRWQVSQAKRVFGGALVVLAAAISLGLVLARVPAMNDNGKIYAELAADLPVGAVVMVNDPPALYYHTGLAGVVIPNAKPGIVPELAARYGVTHLVLDHNRTEPFAGVFAGDETWPFLRLVHHADKGTATLEDDYRVFEIVLPELIP